MNTKLLAAAAAVASLTLGVAANIRPASGHTWPTSRVKLGTSPCRRHRGQGPRRAASAATPA
jgi:hypothetical protein